MLKFFKGTKNSKNISNNNINSNIDSSNSNNNSNSHNNSQSDGKQGLFAKLKASLQKTRHKFVDQIATLCLGKKSIDSELLKTIEAILLSADLGVKATELVISKLTDELKRKELADPSIISSALRKQLTAILAPCEQPLVIPSEIKPFVIFLVGVNGAGKTTTIGKLAKMFQANNKKVMLAAGDTFRAAAIEQLQTWGERNKVPVIAQHTGADSASVIFDAFQAAQAKQYDVLIADTAGRLHTKDNLMTELKKLVRVIKKLDSTAPHEVLLTLDAGIGQNAITQAEQFHQAVGVTGLILTKLDGTAKGGVIFSIAANLQLPLRYIGIGEGMDDLKPFQADEFVQALFNQSS